MYTKHKWDSDRYFNFGYTQYLPKDYGQKGYFMETEREPFRIYMTDEERMRYEP